MSTAKKRDKDQVLLETLEEIRQSNDCLLFSPGPDFALACSCNECRPKITKLKEFEDEFKSKRKLSCDYFEQLDKVEELCVELCVGLFNTAKWTSDMLYSLSRQLESLSASFVGFQTLPQLSLRAKARTGDLVEKSGDPSAAKMVDFLIQFVQLLKDNDLVDETEATVYKNYNIPFGIAAGIDYWKETKANSEASPLLQEISKIEEQKRKLAEERGKSLDPSICKRYIQDQIELVKRFPIEKLYAEADELIHKVCPIYEKKVMLGEIDVCIAKTSLSIVRERKGFWRQFEEQPSSEETARKGQSKTHVSNGLDKTLDLLLTMVDAFNGQWKRVYRPFFSRLDPISRL